MEEPVSAIPGDTGNPPAPSDSGAPAIPGDTGNPPAPSDNGVKTIMVPKARLDEVLAERRKLAERLAVLEAAPPQAPTHVADPAPRPDDENPPVSLSERERVRWFIERDAGRMIERELGMPLRDAKTLLATSRTTSSDWAEQRWKANCSEHGLDPSDRKVQEFVAGHVKIGVDLGEAFSRARTVYGKPAAPTASVEPGGGVSQTMAAERTIPQSREKAVEMALKGISAPFQNSQDLIRASLERERSQTANTRRIE